MLALLALCFFVMVVAVNANDKFSYTIALGILQNVSLIGVMLFRYGGGCER